MAQNLRLQLKLYSIITDAVDNGVRYGWSRVWKHRTRPPGLAKCIDDEILVNELVDHVLSALGEVIDFEKSTVAPKK